MTLEPGGNGRGGQSAAEIVHEIEGSAPGVTVELEPEQELLMVNMGPHHPATHGVLRLEVELEGGGRTVLLPWNFARIHGGARVVTVQAVHAKHFANVPALRNPEQITLLEEDKICGYYGGGVLYAHPSRLEPIL